MFWQKIAQKIPCGPLFEPPDPFRTLLAPYQPFWFPMVPNIKKYFFGEFHTLQDQLQLQQDFILKKSSF